MVDNLQQTFENKKLKKIRECIEYEIYNNYLTLAPSLAHFNPIPSPIPLDAPVM